MSNLPAWLIWLPLAGAVSSWLAPRWSGVAAALGASLLTAVVALAVALQAWTGRAQAFPMGGFAAPLGIELLIDGLSAWMLLLTALISLAVGVYAAAYLENSTPGFWPVWMLLWGGLNALYLSADLFNLYVTLEVVSLSAVALVTLSEERVALTAAMRYLLAAMFGSLAYLLGVALVYAEHGFLGLVLLSEAGVPGAATAVALVLLTLGLLLKTAIFPFHFWLPLAHASAPAPVSALLSGLVVKASYYLLLRLWLYTFGALPLTLAAQILGVLGAAALIYGSLQALRQERLKLLIAYSTVAQLGYLCVALPLVIGTAPEVRAMAYQGLAYHVVAHGLVKAALFLAAGGVLRGYGHDRVAELKGLATRMPVSTFVLALAAASLIGLPPSGGFVAKWWLVGAAVQGEQLGWGLALLFGGLLTALYMFRVIALGMPRGSQSEEPRRESLLLGLPAFALALAAVAIGLRSVELIELLSVGAPFEVQE